MRMKYLVAGLLALVPVFGVVPSALAAAPKAKASTHPALAEGDVTRAQLQAQVRGVFKLADTNKDGFMSKAEFRVRMGAVLNRTPPGTAGAPTREQAQRMLNAADAAFKAVDKNGDGKLSLSEASQRPLAAFDMMDTDHNGILTMAEKAAHAAAEPLVAPAKAKPGR